MKMVVKLLEGKTGSEKANIKGQEIAKIGSVPRQNVKFSEADYDIEIQSVKVIEGGVEVFARAWTSSGEQVGFGKDGTVDLERFRFINPPILVSDPNGDIIREWTEDGIAKQRKLKENPQLALLQTLAHTIKVSTKDNPMGRVIKGKVGNTTSTFFPDADVETTSVDGQLDIETATWAGSHDAAAGDAARPSGATLSTRARLLAGNYFISRDIYLFDTSGIGSGQQVDSATLSLAGTGTVENNVDTTTYDVVASTPASNTDLVAGDFDQLGTTVFGEFAVSGWNQTADTYNDITLTNISAISVTGITKLGGRNSRDTDNVAPTGDNSIDSRSADTAGTTSDPKLVVVHSAAAAVSNFLLMGV